MFALICFEQLLTLSGQITPSLGYEVTPFIAYTMSYINAEGQVISLSTPSPTPSGSAFPAKPYLPHLSGSAGMSSSTEDTAAGSVAGSHSSSSGGNMKKVVSAQTSLDRATKQQLMTKKQVSFSADPDENVVITGGM
eukprot:sb/3474525/